MCSLMKMCMKEAASFPDRKCCWSSTLSSAQAPGFEWQGSVHSDWPHSSLSPPSSTGLQRGWGCCCGCSGRPSPGPPGCVTPLRSCCCPPPSSPGSRLRGSPRWPDTPVWHCPAAAPLWRGGGGSGWDAPHPLEEREREGGGEGGEKTKSWEWRLGPKEKSHAAHFFHFIKSNRRTCAAVALTNLSVSDHHTHHSSGSKKLHGWRLLRTSSSVFPNVWQWRTRPCDDFLLFQLTELKHSCESSSNLCHLSLSLPFHYM